MEDGEGWGYVGLWMGGWEDGEVGMWGKGWKGWRSGDG